MKKTFETLFNLAKKSNEFAMQLTYWEVAIIIIAALNLGLFYFRIFKYLTAK